MTCQFCKCEIPDTNPFNFCPACGQTIASFQDSFSKRPGGNVMNAAPSHRF